MADPNDNIDLIWLNQTDEESGPGPEPVSDYALLWEDGVEMTWEDGSTILLELDEVVEPLALTLVDGQAITTETGDELLMEAA